jgi:hypothetical protein
MLTQAELKRQLYYNPETGLFTWKISKCNNKIKIGDVAGYLGEDGYIQIRINSILYRAHRLAWLYIKGYFPEHDIDHKFGIKDDNRWSEIQHVTRSCNLQNQKIDKRNSSGFPGVILHKKNGKWHSQVTINKKTYSSWVL